MYNYLISMLRDYVQIADAQRHGKYSQEEYWEAESERKSQPNRRSIATQGNNMQRHGHIYYTHRRVSVLEAAVEIGSEWQAILRPIDKEYSLIVAPLLTAWPFDKKAAALMLEDKFGEREFDFLFNFLSDSDIRDILNAVLARRAIFLGSVQNE